MSLYFFILFHKIEEIRSSFDFVCMNLRYVWDIKMEYTSQQQAVITLKSLEEKTRNTFTYNIFWDFLPKRKVKKNIYSESVNETPKSITTMHYILFHLLTC